LSGTAALAHHRRLYRLHFSLGDGNLAAGAFEAAAGCAETAAEAVSAAAFLARGLRSFFGAGAATAGVSASVIVSMSWKRLPNHPRFSERMARCHAPPVAQSGHFRRRGRDQVVEETEGLILTGEGDGDQTRIPFS
jgi:hypothetical protein